MKIEDKIKETELEIATKHTLAEVGSEASRARAKFPDNNLLLAALVEEVGELAKAIIEGGNWHEEAIHVACVAVRIATEGDSTHGLEPPMSEYQPARGTTICHACNTTMEGLVSVCLNCGRHIAPIGGWEKAFEEQRRPGQFCPKCGRPLLVSESPTEPCAKCRSGRETVRCVCGEIFPADYHGCPECGRER